MMNCERRQRLFVMLLLVAAGFAQLGGGVQLVNDTVTGDPFFTVPILVPQSQLKELNTSSISLCYEVHGTAEKYFNLVTDECTSVSAHYHSLNTFLNGINKVAIRAVDTSNVCHNILVTLPNCTALVDSTEVSGSYIASGVHVTRHGESHVHILVPNCKGVPLSMWVVCKECIMEDPTLGRDQFRDQVMEFIVTRQLSFGHRKTHGLIGQFWNIPMSVRSLPVKTKPDTGDSSSTNLYSISYTSAARQQRKTYTGSLHGSTWTRTQRSCLYAGNGQASSVSAEDSSHPNDPVIEGDYRDYQLDEAFSEEGYMFSQFNEDRCSVSSSGEISTVMTTEADRGSQQGGIELPAPVVIVSASTVVAVAALSSMVAMVMCLFCKVLAKRKRGTNNERGSNQSTIKTVHKDEPTDQESYDDIVHNPLKQFTLSRNAAYSQDETSDHVYDEIHDQKVAIRPTISSCQVELSTQTG